MTLWSLLDWLRINQVMFGELDFGHGLFWQERFCSVVLFWFIEVPLFMEYLIINRNTAETQAHIMWESEGVLKLSTEIIIITTTTTTVIILQFKRAAGHTAGNAFFVLSRNRSPGVISDLSTVVAVSSKLWRHVTVFQTFLIPFLLTFPFSEGRSLCILKRKQRF